MEGRGHAPRVQQMATDDTRGDEGDTKGKRKGDEEEYGEATLQQHSTERACHDDVYFLNEDFFTKHFGDHWGGQLKTKRR